MKDRFLFGVFIWMSIGVGILGPIAFLTWNSYYRNGDESIGAIGSNILSGKLSILDGGLYFGAMVSLVLSSWLLSSISIYLIKRKFYCQFDGDVDARVSLLLISVFISWGTIVFLLYSFANPGLNV